MRPGRYNLPERPGAVLPFAVEAIFSEFHYLDLWCPRMVFMSVKLVNQAP